jgi:hypothetical protein
MTLEHRTARQHARHLGSGHCLEVVDNAVITDDERTVRSTRQRGRETVLVRA